MTNTPNYGNCFTFNSELNTGDQYAGKRICSMTGPQFGLEMVINIDQGNYMTGGQTQQAGARLTVQDTPFNPLPDEFGSNVMPNTQTAFSIQEVNITRYPTPYTSNCTSDWTHTNYSSYLVNPNYNYSLAVGINRIFFCYTYSLLSSKYITSAFPLSHSFLRH